VADGGGDPIPRPGEVVLVHVDKFDDTDAAELATLDRDFGERLRDGTVTLNEPGYEFLFGRPPPGYPEMMTTPGRPATGLATTVADAIDFRLVEMPAQLRDEVTRWDDLEKRAALDDVTILLAPPPAAEPPPGGVRALACLD
jgi:hypothetical protein